MKRIAGTLLAAVGGLFVYGRALPAQEPQKPNIVLILVDNLGWGELGVYGGGALRGAPTPRIDAFAGQGLRLLNFNVDVSCTPTRSELMTGRFAIRSGTLHSEAAGKGGLVAWEVTIAQLLSAQKYDTALFGKWHLGDRPGRFPTDHGFDEWYGIPRTSNEAGNYSSPGYDPQAVPPMYIEAGTKTEATHPVKPYNLEARRQIDGELTAKTIAFMEKESSAHHPFFAYVPLTQVHFPTLPSAEFAGRTGYGDFADSVVQMDADVGRILDAIDRLRLADNTVVIFASDNGPEYRRPWRGTAGPWTGTYHTAFEGSLRTPFIIRWPGKIKPGVSNEIVHAVDVFATLARIGGASIPTDRAIDGVDDLDFFMGKQDKSPRRGFPIYIEDKMYAVKWENWKYHMIWLPQAEDKPVELARPYLFNVIVDPKEETPRALLEDGWVRQPILKLIGDMNKSLAMYPPIPNEAPNSYVPQRPLTVTPKDPTAADSASPAPRRGPAVPAEQ